MVITTPNCQGFDMVELGTTASSFGYIYAHLFNPFSLGALLEKHSFEIVETATPGLMDVDLVRRAYRNLDDGQKAGLSPFPLELLLNGDENVLDSFQNFLSANLLSSHMCVTARKR